MFVTLMIVALTLSLTAANAKDDGKKDCASTSACCKKGTTDKASLTTKASTAKVMLVSDKKTLAKDAKDCTTPAECAKQHCDMKASAMKEGTMDCCKDAKATKAKMTKVEKKSSTEKAEAKGTN